ncbi:MAG TPA: NUDIX domain-containing protein [Cyclobacteriaceae bacterium]|nr:NUDIX domain-containing protein [Cyclobacteriaceae bacterium]HRJ82255.1 NUDIX domain-containing protein [Cyclobacteriaceae bacterium]
MNENIKALYGNKIRVRVAGLCWKDDSLLLVNHSLYKGQDFWAPPGGGLDFGQRMEDCLKQEFMEETGLQINVDGFRFVAEFVNPPLHAIELFADVSISGGVLTTGYDPELTAEGQIIRAAKFVPWETVLAMPAQIKHGILKLCATVKELKTLTGFYRI